MSAAFNNSLAALALAKQNQYDSGQAFTVFSGALVLLMQLGFAMQEAGSVSHASILNILFKNMFDAILGAISFWLVGYAIAFGGEAPPPSLNLDTVGLRGNGFEGITSDATLGTETGEYAAWFYQFTFAATAATIVSGAVAERAALSAYFVYSILLSALIYPIGVFYGWSGGFNAVWNDTLGMPGSMHDFAGSGIVHMVGGISGLVGALTVGPRDGRFEDPDDDQFKPHNVTLQALGTFILWFGWYGFNCGSGPAAIAGKVATTTTLAAASCACTSVVLARFWHRRWDVSVACNGIIAGLVSVTAGADAVEPWGAFVSGVIGAPLYMGTSALLKRRKIDDPLDAFAVHGVCGLWGLLAVGLFGTRDAFLYSTGEDYGCLEVACPDVLSANLAFGAALALWTLFTSGAVFGMLRLVGVLMRWGKYPYYAPAGGLDRAEHGGSAYVLELVRLD